MDTKRQIALVYRKSRIGEEEPDREYWLSQPVEARLDALEAIRREYHLLIYGEEPRMEKVITIVKRTKRQKS